VSKPLLALSSVFNTHQLLFLSIFNVISDLRQVPDTQEVLLSPDSDITAILEVLECVSENGADRSLEEAIK